MKQKCLQCALESKDMLSEEEQYLVPDISNDIAGAVRYPVPQAARSKKEGVDYEAYEK